MYKSNTLRSILVRLIPAILLLTVAGLQPAFAGSCGPDQRADARSFVLQLAKTANEIKARNTNVLAPMMVHIFDNFAIDLLTRPTQSGRWTEATAAQRVEYKILFTRISLHTLATLAIGLADVGLVVRETQELNADQTLVRSEIRTDSTNTMRLDWWIVYRNCRPYIADIVFDGVSLLTTKRQEIDSVVSRLGVDGLIERLRAMARTQAAEAQFAELDLASLDKLILEAARKP
jgi:ABC-type transporter MlaC component